MKLLNSDRMQVAGQWLSCEVVRAYRSDDHTVQVVGNWLEADGRFKRELLRVGGFRFADDTVRLVREKAP